MARSFALIPDDQYQRLLGKGAPRDDGAGGVGGSGGGGSAMDDSVSVGPELRVYGLDRTGDDMLSTLAELLPRNLRSKARLLLHHLNGKVALDADSRVVYETDGGGKKVGSHLLDLVRSLVSPAGTFDVQRPVDLPQFASAILGIVPQSALGAGKYLAAIASDTPGPPGRRKLPTRHLPRKKTVTRKKSTRRPTLQRRR